ncbi:type I secretion system permease/ATPase [Paludibacterium purpuratum]|uniref:Cyclolysin secretion/processing ATP-binding protein CyaB n=1 Tax=Paludibacterium purpuratum TaxID=1144873 RepID=A0A4V3DVT2_9NEIS|nr:type I secretion system permease/ATPase [Paludibacterium purpuratum]TDR82129.1 ATP-binding cassette subfamily C protein LapB [Paludibacterium purpuratum]
MIDFPPHAEPVQVLRPKEPGQDPLRACLLALAQHYGLPPQPETVFNGLPEAEGKLTPSLFVRAADRLGLTARIARMPATDWRPELLPVVLLLQDDQACLLDRCDEQGYAHIRTPTLIDGTSRLLQSELAERYSGLCILVKPRYQPERRAAAAADGHWFWLAVRKGWPLYRDAFLAAFLINLCALAVPIVTMNIYDRVVPNLAFSTLWVLAVGAGLVQVFDFLLKLARSHLLDLAGKRIDIDLSARIMERVLGLRLEHRPPSVGAFAANLRAFESVRDFIASSSVATLVDLPFTLIFVLILLWLSPWFAVPVILAAGLMLLQAWFAASRMRTLSESTLRASAERNALLIESLTGLETIKSQSAQGVQQARWERSTHYLAQTGARLKILSALTSHFAGFVQQTTYLATLVLGVYLILDGRTSAGGIIAAGMLSSRATVPLSQLVNLLTQYHQARASLASVESVMRLPTERDSAMVYAPRAPFAGGIELKNVEFGYPGAKLSALSGVSLRIVPGERVAILGSIGSGKSTIQKLIMGLYQPSAGTVLIDGIDLRQIDPDELRREVGYVPQESLLLSGSLRHNLTLGRPEVPVGRLQRALNIAGLGRFVNQHPDGFDMPIGERGATLSGGQRRALCVARAWVAEPTILLMDEPTSNMDPGQARRMIQALSGVMAGKTLLVVTHQADVLELVDRIIVIEGGRVVADGPKKQVLDALTPPAMQKEAQA